MDNDPIQLSHLKGVFLLAVGKASLSMMQGALDVLGRFATGGILITQSTKSLPRLDDRIQTFHSGHPIPTRSGLKASRQVINALRNLNEDNTLLCLISGGASAMLPAPAKGITLQDKIKVTRQLIRSEATIHEVNTVRRHISSLKGGRLLSLCRVSRVISLLLSDVPGNRLTDIGSGLTAKDPTSYQDAIEVLKRHHLWLKAPEHVKRRLHQGARGILEEKARSESSSLQRVRNIVIADNQTACVAAQNYLKKQTIHASILTSSTEREAQEIGKLLAKQATRSGNAESRAVIVGGECIVRVKGKGEGGRNQEVALSAVAGIAGHSGVAVASIGTDGIDGTTKVAGAIIDGNTAERAHRRKLETELFLARNDSGRFFRQLGDYLMTGPTGTNVGDIYLMVSIAKPIRS